MTPNLFIPGAAKSGTSSLHDYLNQHPSVFMSSVKEPHYFSHANTFRNKSAYYNLFSGKETFAYRGESSTGYMVFPGVIERIKREIENPRFIFILRNPIDRAFSHYNWVRSFAAEQRDFREAVNHDATADPDPEKSFGKGYKYYFQFGLYGKYIENFYHSFDPETIHVISSEALKNSSLEVMNEIFRFLSLDPMDDMPEFSSNETVFYEDGIRKLAAVNDSVERLAKNSIGKGLKTIIPESVRIRLREALGKYSDQQKQKKRAEKRPVIKLDNRAWLGDMYRKDVQKLKDITGLSFAEWHDFS